MGTSTRTLPTLPLPMSMTDTTYELPISTRALPATARTSLVRPLLAIVAGLGVMALLVAPPTLMSALAALRGLLDAPVFRPPMGFIIFNIGLNILGGVMSGSIVARLTRGRARYPVMAMAALLALSSALDAVKVARSGGHVWVPLLIVVLVPLAVLAGGHVEEQRSATKPAA